MQQAGEPLEAPAASSLDLIQLIALTASCACPPPPGEARCDGWMFYEPSNSYYDDYPGCSFIDIKDSAIDSPAAFPASDYQDYRFWVRNGKYTIPPC